MKFQLGGGAGPPAPPLGYAYAPSEENKTSVRKFSARFLAFSNEISTVQQIVLSSSRGQGNFRGLEASRPRLDLRSQGQGLQNVSSRTSSRPRTSSRTPPLVFNTLIKLFIISTMCDNFSIAIARYFFPYLSTFIFR